MTPRLRIMVCPHELVTGGSQINAIDLAAHVRDRGHTVEIFAAPGPLVSLIASYGLPYRHGPELRADRINFAVLKAFYREYRRFRPDIVHTYESPPTTPSTLVSVAHPVAQVVTIMSMSIPDFIPRHVPLTVGTRQIARQLGHRRSQVHVIEPPIDTQFDAPGPTGEAREALHVDQEDFVVSVVGRLSDEHEKARGVAEAINELSQRDLPGRITLLIAGAGDAEAAVRNSAAEANRRNKLLSVRLQGNVSDPRAVYDAADVVFGMGSSALRAMSHGKPLIVQGRQAFWKLLTPETAEEFFLHGYFGTGPTHGPTFAELVIDLMGRADYRRELGDFGREVVVHRHTIDVAVDSLERIYWNAVLEGSRRNFSGAVGTLLRYGKFRIAVSMPVLQRLSRRIRRV